ncbi:MAG: hypothetical protein H7067_13130, partial [Burkholderiales bacterium]|nr:hypothetical protein [Opitutaceae bacterium]
MFSSGSIKWRLQLWHGVLLFVVTATLLVAYHRSERREAVARLDRELRLILLVVSPELRPPRPPGAPPPPPSPRSANSDESDAQNTSASNRNPVLAEFASAGGFVVHRMPARAVIRTFLGEPPPGLEADFLALSRTVGDGFVERHGHRILWH